MLKKLIAIALSAAMTVSAANAVFAADYNYNEGINFSFSASDSFKRLDEHIRSLTEEFIARAEKTRLDAENRMNAIITRANNIISYYSDFCWGTAEETSAEYTTEDVTEEVSETTESYTETTTDETTSEAVTENTEAASYSAFVYEVFELTNKERTAAGVPQLKLNDGLCRAAADHAADMALNDYFDHTSLDGKAPRDRVNKYCSFNYIGENIAAGQTSPEEVVSDWLNSEGHRKNILSENYTDIGIGWADGYWVQDFGG